MLTGKSGYDLVVPGIAFLPRQIQAGAYQKINKDLIPNYKDINPKLLEMLATADPGNEYAVPYFSGVNTVAITAKGKEALGGQLPENGWDLLFKPEYTSKLKRLRHRHVGYAERSLPHHPELSGQRSGR